MISVSRHGALILLCTAFLALFGLGVVLTAPDLFADTDVQSNRILSSR